MAINSSRRADCSHPRARDILFIAALAVTLLTAFACNARAQARIGEGDLGACTLNNHVYTCDAASFQKALTGATTVSLETHNADGIARSALKELVANKLHKTIVPDGTPADLVFLLMPIDEGGQIETNSSLQDLGTLRVYSTTPEGRSAHLLWAETYTGEHDVSWPIVARSVIAKFERRFHIK
jgi:hypothetical protein